MILIVRICYLCHAGTSWSDMDISLENRRHSQSLIIDLDVIIVVLERRNEAIEFP